MRTIKIKKSDLLSKLKANLKMHLKNYKEACEGYRAEAIAVLQARIEHLKTGENVDVNFYDVKPPESHENDYNIVIAMMEMSVDVEVEITTNEFQCYCMDDWDWKQDWTSSNSKYCMTAPRR